jgi:drug/metabolite transporter (DMT)-like permease
MERQQVSGYLFGVLAALCWATSPIFIRKGLAGLSSSYWGVTVGLAASTGVYLAWLIWRGAGSPDEAVRRVPLSQAFKAALFFQALAGVAAALGTLGRTIAIQLAPVVVVIPLAQTSSLFTLIFAPLILGRRLERVTVKLILGALFVVAGSALVIVGQNL